jgi:methylglutaconyl-CoA hydratase
MLNVEIRGAVGYLTIDRPDVRNALGPEVVAELATALDRIESDAAMRAVVLSGSGKVFSAGADLGSMRKQGGADAESNRRNALEMGRLFHRIYDFPKPVVARVPGPAIGGGVGLMTACDVIVAVEGAFFSFSEVRLGIVPALISPFCIRRLGVAKARKLFLTGERISAPLARELGLVDEVTAESDLDAGVDRVLDALLQGAPGALAAAKRLVSEVAHLSPGEALPFTADLLATLRASDEAREGMTAFLEKRAPSWKPTRD